MFYFNPICHKRKGEIIIFFIVKLIRISLLGKSPKRPSSGMMTLPTYKGDEILLKITL